MLATFESYEDVNGGKVPIEPPITRIARVSAVTVAMRSSGQMIVVMMDAGTTIPPIPSPARTRMPHSWWRLKRSAHARAPHPGGRSELQ